MRDEPVGTGAKDGENSALQVSPYRGTQFTLLARTLVHLISHLVRHWIARHVHYEAHRRDVAVSPDFLRAYRISLRRVEVFDCSLGHRPLSKVNEQGQ